MSDYTPFGPRSQPTDGLVPPQQPDPGRGPGDDRYRQGERVRVDPDCGRPRAGQYGVISLADEDGLPEVDFGDGERSYISDDDLLPA